MDQHIYVAIASPVPEFPGFKLEIPLGISFQLAVWPLAMEAPFVYMEEPPIVRPTVQWMQI